MQALYFCRAIVCCVTVVLVCCVFVCVTGIDIAVLEFDVECGVVWVNGLMKTQGTSVQDIP